MKTTQINLYNYSELNAKAQAIALSEHASFLISIGQEVENEDGELVMEYSDTIADSDVIESIEANEYLFYFDGKIAPCTTYTGKHEKAGITELNFHGQAIVI